jgi:hypothetical protein
LALGPSQSSLDPRRATHRAAGSRIGTPKESVTSHARGARRILPTRSHPAQIRGAAEPGPWRRPRPGSALCGSPSAFASRRRWRGEASTTASPVFGGAASQSPRLPGVGCRTTQDGCRPAPVAVPHDLASSVGVLPGRRGHDEQSLAGASAVGAATRATRVPRITGWASAGVAAALGANAVGLGLGLAGCSRGNQTNSDAPAPRRAGRSLEPPDFAPMFQPGVRYRLNGNNGSELVVEVDEAGDVNLATGRLVGCDPFWVVPGAGTDADAPYTVTVPPGRYPVDVSFARQDRPDPRSTLGGRLGAAASLTVRRVGAAFAVSARVRIQGPGCGVDAPACRFDVGRLASISAGSGGRVAGFRPGTPYRWRALVS